jgi:acetyl-CoA carboxylase carboxyltransferase component
LADTEIYETDLNKVSYNLNELANTTFDVRSLINEIVDTEFLEIKSDLNNQEVIGLSRIGGRTVGIVANQCFENSGSLDINSFNKIGRFVRFCDAFGLPIITMVNAKGYDLKANSDIINAGSRLMYAYAEATVPKINVLIGDAFGSMYIALGNLGKDITYAWPNVNMGVLKAETLVSIKDSQNISNNDLRNEKIEEYKNNNEDVLNALNKGYIDDIIEPATTRQRIISALELFINKRENRPVKKHGNIPF